jgi:hypothetical protein
VRVTLTDPLFHAKQYRKYCRDAHFFDILARSYIGDEMAQNLSDIWLIQELGGYDFDKILLYKKCTELFRVQCNREIYNRFVNVACFHV